jgi:predicted dehydrogenase
MRRQLVPALAQLGCTIVAVIDPDVDKGSPASREVGEPAADALAAAAHLGRIGAIVAACTPSGHEQMTREAISCGVPILAEKPPAACDAALRELAQLTLAAGVPAYVGMKYGHASGFKALRTRVVGKNRRVEYANVNASGARRPIAA